jgi:hypothetical protein
MLMGHSVLLVPVPELEAFVAERWRHYDPQWVSHDPAFAHAHITLLAPFLPTQQPDPGELGRLAEIIGGTGAFAFELSEVATFPNGIVHLRVHPDESFRRLTAALVAAYPECPPYAGEFPDPVPHLTLDLAQGAVTEDTVAAAAADLLPANCHAERVQLAWYEAGASRVLHEWSLQDSSVAPALNAPSA